MASSDDQGALRNPKDLPVRFPRSTSFTMKPGHYRAMVEKLREFGIYEHALKALEDNGVRVILRSDDPDGVSKAMATIQEQLTKSPLYVFASTFMRMAEPTNDPGATEGCPIGKFLIAK